MGIIRSRVEVVGTGVCDVEIWDLVYLPMLYE